MSVRMNGYERRLVEALRNHLSKRDAEEAIYEIREGLYGDMYEQIRPEHVADERGKITHSYPPIKKIIWAYFNDRWDVFSAEKEVAEEEKKEETTEEEVVVEETTKPQMTKKQRKEAMWLEVERLATKFPELDTYFAQQIALANMDYQNKITDDFLGRVIEQAQKIDVWGKDAWVATNLSTRNSTTNCNNLKKLMGEALFNEMLEKPINWGYYASLYDSIIRKQYGF